MTEGNPTWDAAKAAIPSVLAEQINPLRVFTCSTSLKWKSVFTGGNKIKMSNALQLYIPRPEDGWFYVKMMSDPATMAYNAPWFPPDGCIPAPEDEWLEMQESFIGKEPERFCAFLQRKCDGAFVGDVNYHYNPKQDWYDMGIVIYAPERGKGYGRQGLHLLLDRAFKVDGVSRLHNDFETDRDSAYHIHKAVGFRETGTLDGFIQLELTREEYLQDSSVRWEG